MTYMLELEKSTTYSHTWLGLNPHIVRPLSWMIVPLVQVSYRLIELIRFSIINLIKEMNLLHGFQDVCFLYGV
jgi:hypothetical protein